MQEFKVVGAKCAAYHNEPFQGRSHAAYPVKSGVIWSTGCWSTGSQPVRTDSWSTGSQPVRTDSWSTGSQPVRTD